MTANTSRGHKPKMDISIQKKVKTKVAIHIDFLIVYLTWQLK